MIDPNAPPVKRLMVVRILLVVVAIAAAATAATRPADILAMVGWAFSLAMAGGECDSDVRLKLGADKPVVPLSPG